MSTQVGVTLYNLRETCKTEDGLRRSLEMLRRCGCVNVQVSGVPLEPAVVRKALDEFGMRCCATHGILSGNALEKIHNSALEEVFITDTIPHPELEGDSKIRIVSMAPVFASIIDKVYNYEPISIDFDY